ncbi:addiction module toxin RelE [Candidatus Woesearchaeota archaeon]|nr:addiction module toxin RelE [Candidatus Woesearchaeota archaeon]
MKHEIHPDLDKILSKLAKRDRVQFEAVLKKIDEIVNSAAIDHYKNLRAPLQKYKRVHVYSSFVLLFRVEGDVIIFRYYDHHDNIYSFAE